MEAESLAASLTHWRNFVDRTRHGKRIGDAVYVHVSSLPDEFAPWAADIAAIAECAPDAFTVVRVALGRPRVTLLNYPRFFDEAFPLLAASWTVDLDTDEVERRSYREDANPPVLHRKELLLDSEHPRRPEFEALTRAAEAHGLFADTAIIGHRHQWDEELRARGLRVEGHHLVAIGDASSDLDAQQVLRHRTALTRRALSTPMQALWRHGYLTAGNTILDYGCGRGDDLAALQANGLEAEGWDPYFRPEGLRAESDVVNLGFVLNVIEDLAERAAALTGAYGYARRVLAVSALIGGRTAFERYRLFRDGVLTSRGTFQKYYSQQELGAYIAEVLGREPVSVGPGLFFVFRTDEDEQDFLERRQRSASRPVETAPAPPRVEALTPRKRPVRERAGRRGDESARTLLPEERSELVESFWQACVALGRLPREGEFERVAELSERVGSPGLVLRRLIEGRGEATWEAARARRKGDLSVFLALNLFERRRSANAHSERVKVDLREFWGAASRAQDDAKSLLFSLRDVGLIAKACERAASEGVGHLVAGESLQLDARLVNALPPALRVYVGCAGKLYGEAQDADMVKVHIASGKVSLMNYDDYEGAAIPMLIERVKVDLRRQQVDYFQYGEEFEPQPLYVKSRYMHAGLEGYDAQREFDAKVLALEGFDWSGYGPKIEDVRGVLEALSPPEGLVVMAR